MTRQSLAVGGLLAAAAALLLLMPEKSEAQAHRFGRGGLAVRIPGSGFSSSPGYPDSSDGFGAGYYGLAPRTYYGWSSTPSYAPVGYVRSWPGGWYGPSSSYAESPGYYGSGVGYPMTRYGTFSFSDVPSPTYYGQGPERASGLGDNRSVLINLQVPPEAEVWFDDHKTERTGTFRQYISPPLDPGRPYSYHVRVQWTDDGEQVSRERTLRVQAGDELSLDFLMPTAETGADFPSDRVGERAPTFPGGTGERGTFDQDTLPAGRPGDTPSPGSTSGTGGTGDRP